MHTSVEGKRGGMLDIGEKAEPGLCAAARRGLTGPALMQSRTEEGSGCMAPAQTTLKQSQNRGPHCGVSGGRSHEGAFGLKWVKMKQQAHFLTDERRWLLWLLPENSWTKMTG